MTSSTALRLRLFLAGAVLLAAVITALVFTGVVPPYSTKKFSDADFAPPVPAYRVVSFDDLPGWRQDDPGEALEAFVRSCAKFEGRDPAAPANPMENLGLSDASVTFSGTVADWLRPCVEARTLIDRTYADADNRRGAFRSFFEFHFAPVQIMAARAPLPDGRARRAGLRLDERGVFTGYFEPIYHASHEKSGNRTAPVLPRPDDLVEVDLGLFRDELKGERIAGRVDGGRLRPYEERRDIEARAAQNALAWLDPNDLFFLQIQGSGRLVFDDGSVMRIGYAGQNGHPYTAIGRVLVERGAMPLEEVSMQSIRNWLAEAPAARAADLRWANASYVFFRKLDVADSALGPPGAQGVALTPGRSLAVDRRFHTLGAPVWVDIEPPAGGDGKPIRRLMIAQDTGGAIKGPVRGDIFWGSGDEAAALAGAMNAKGALTVLLPRRLVERLPRTAPPPRGMSGSITDGQS